MDQTHPNETTEISQLKEELARINMAINDAIPASGDANTPEIQKLTADREVVYIKLMAAQGHGPEAIQDFLKDMDAMEVEDDEQDDDESEDEEEVTP